jgi:hypothetical protein
VRRFAALLLLCACQARRPGAGGVELVPAPAAADVASWVRASAEPLRARGRVVLVYEGASWCAPCRAFHDAAAAGALDAALPGVTLLEFDADRDGERLASAGYVSNLIPLFATSGADGRFSGSMIEGGISGSGAVDELLPRLQALIAGR